MKDFKATCKNLNDVECVVRVKALNEAGARRLVQAKNKYLTIIKVEEAA